MLTRLCKIPLDIVLEAMSDDKISLSIKHQLQDKFGKCGYNCKGDVRLTSARLQTYRCYGTACSRCGLKAHFFAAENHHVNECYHLNLYGYSIFGKEIMITSDHIIPKAMGGHNGISNRQPMCINCNHAKDNKLSASDIDEFCRRTVMMMKRF